VKENMARAVFLEGWEGGSVYEGEEEQAEACFELFIGL